MQPGIPMTTPAAAASTGGGERTNDNASKASPVASEHESLQWNTAGGSACLACLSCPCSPGLRCRQCRANDPDTPGRAVRHGYANIERLVPMHRCP